MLKFLLWKEKGLLTRIPTLSNCLKILKNLKKNISKRMKIYYENWHNIAMYVCVCAF